MPGDVLLFQCLSNSTIGAVRFHGRVRDGIGWVTDAMVTKQWSLRIRVLIDVSVHIIWLANSLLINGSCSDLSLMVGLLSANRAIRTG